MVTAGCETPQLVNPSVVVLCVEMAAGLPAGPFLRDGAVTLCDAVSVTLTIFSPSLVLALVTRSHVSGPPACTVTHRGDLPEPVGAKLPRTAP